jgi:TrmH family RNA methyltransferase
MLSKNKIRFLVSLQKKKVRDELRLFIIEGDKLVKEFLNAGMSVKSIYATNEFLNSLPDERIKDIKDIYQVNFEELDQISSLKTPHNVLAVVHMPDIQNNYENVSKSLCIALDFVQDPGNLGTIIRTAAWFGIRNIVCSPDCADLYNPKVIQASMGAIIHTNVTYTSLPEFLSSARARGLPIYGTLLEGHSIYDYKLVSPGVILLGNESKGISGNLIPCISDRIMIPKINTFSDGIDSLNVSMAAAIICSEFARRSGYSKDIS